MVGALWRLIGGSRVLLLVLNEMHATSTRNKPAPLSTKNHSRGWFETYFVFDGGANGGDRHEHHDSFKSLEQYVSSIPLPRSVLL